MKSYTKTVLDVVVKKFSKNYFCEGRNVISNCQLKRMAEENETAHVRKRALPRHVKDVVREYVFSMMKICLINTKKEATRESSGSSLSFCGAKSVFFLEWKDFSSKYSTATKWPTWSLITKKLRSSILTIFWSCQNGLMFARGQPNPALRLRVSWWHHKNWWRHKLAKKSNCSKLKRILRDPQPSKTKLRATDTSWEGRRTSRRVDVLQVQRAAEGGCQNDTATK